MNLELLYDFALEQVGVPYEWGGEGPDRPGGFGWDCSALVRAILRRGGFKQFERDMVAHDIFKWLKNPMNGGLVNCSRGAIACFGSEERCSHVGWMVDAKVMISAAGGGPGCTSRDFARQRNAAVKMQPIKIYRIPPLLGIWLPPYPFYYENKA